MKFDRPISTIRQFILAQRSAMLALFFGVLVPLFGFGWLVVAVRDHEELAWDAAVLKFLHSLTAPGGDEIMGFVARNGRIEVVVVLAVIGVLVLKRLRRLCDALFVTLAIVGLVIINLLVRAAVHRAPLPGWGSLAFDSGFPSIQAATTFAIAFAFAILTWPTRWRWLTTALGAFYVLAVGLSRAYLGLHYPSDILAGWALSLAWVTAVSFVRRLPIKL